MILREMRQEDIDEILNLQEIVYEAMYIEPIDTFTSHLASSLSCCIVLETADMQVVGYGIAHPSGLGLIDPLSSVVVLPSENSSVLYIHDICLHPDFRGLGLALSMLRFIANRKQYVDFEYLTLVSIESALSFWFSIGFRPASTSYLEALNSYGAGSMYLVCSRLDLIQVLFPVKLNLAILYE